MSLLAVRQLRDAIAADAALAAFFQTHWARAPIIKGGYKRSANAADFPAISFLPAEERRPAVGLRRDIVSIVVGINQQGEADGFLQGFDLLEEAKELLLESIQELTAGDARVIWDRGERAPFFEIEIMVQLAYRDPAKPLNHTRKR